MTLPPTSNSQGSSDKNLLLLEYSVTLSPQAKIIGLKNKDKKRETCDAEELTFGSELQPDLSPVKPSKGKMNDDELYSHAGKLSLT